MNNYEVHEILRLRHSLYYKLGHDFQSAHVEVHFVIVERRTISGLIFRALWENDYE